MPKESKNKKSAAFKKQRKKLEYAKRRVEHLETELALGAQLYASQTKLLAIFREDLRRIIRKIEAHDPAINELKLKLRELPQGVNWKEFEEQFRQVHPEFRGNLLKKYPELTEIELKVSALLRLKLKTPDIARLLNPSERTIDNHRHRIRKKIGLDGSVDFAKFLAVF